MKECRTMARNKYRAKRTTIDGMTFDSKAESRRYKQLKLLERVGDIEHLECQPRYVLEEGFKNTGLDGKARKIQPIAYIADFKYYDKQRGVWIVEDVKGKRTEVYRIKRKLFLKRYVANDPTLFFVELHTSDF